ncbi:agmatine deiminase [Desulforamulus ruminis]|uniref:Putative agmatine deiminase n=1 Tax=Desulforamulus ruminis (strain ATCC 23193 / DSM 2154 / NCIMB 8452 / DL) TaxID=696281 RepID=F6DQH6_DESRL|nr:agmatine deiminase [Desulforamulus ruminis]AEG60870.1 agmatine deiminase [Desulforamulus ruminis DSM 2154]
MTPGDFHFKMPAEWSRHACTFMEWPVHEEQWPDCYHEAKGAFAEVARTIASFEPVTMLANPEQAREAARLCGPTVRIVSIEHDDSWMRDNGPTFVVNLKGEVAGVNWIFNAWGEKFRPWAKDDQVAPELLKQLGLPCFNAPIVLEGGSVHVDGEGTLLTTEECLLNKNRNPHLSKEEIEEVLRKFLGIEKLIWLKKGLYGDETDGHVDNVACFAEPGVILVHTCSNRNEPNYEILKENLAILEKSSDAKGRKLEIIKMELPPVQYFGGERLTLSYINFYFVNGGIVLPVFGGECEETDRQALQVLQKTLCNRKVVTVNGLPIVKGGGNVHCITQQMPGP